MDPMDYVNALRRPVDYSLAAGLGGRRNATNIGPGISALADNGMKSKGFFGPLLNARGQPMTEYSADDQINGRNVQFPMLVPTLSREEVSHLTEGNGPTDAIYEKARAHAQERILRGQSPFAQANEVVPLPRRKR